MKICCLIDKYPIMRLGLQFLREQHFQNTIFHSAEKINDFLEVIPGHPPDTLVIGLKLDNKLNGPRLIEKCKSAYPFALFIIHAKNPEAGTAHHLLKLDIKGIVLTQNDPSELINCIDAAQTRMRHLSPQVREIVFARMRTDSVTEQHHNLEWLKTCRLTLHLMHATLFAKGMKTSEIAKLMKLSPSTVSTTKMIILKKTNAANIVELNSFLKRENYKSKDEITTSDGL